MARIKWMVRVPRPADNDVVVGLWSEVFIPQMKENSLVALCRKRQYTDTAMVLADHQGRPDALEYR